jgi:hypothetical protein
MRRRARREGRAVVERVPLGRLDLAAAAGAAIGLALIGGAAWRLAPIGADLAVVRGEADAARPPGALAEADLDPATFAAIRAEVDLEWRRVEPVLAPFLRGEPLSLGQRLAALHAWRELRLVWAHSLTAHNVSSEQYRAAAARDPRPYDVLLVGGARP